MKSINLKFLGNFLVFFLVAFFCNFSHALATENSPTNVATSPTNKTKSDSTAPDVHSHALGIGLGETFLYGDYYHLGENKLDLDAFYAYKASYSFDFLVNFHSATYKKENQKIDLTGIAFDIKARLFDFDSFAPFIAGGLGLYWPKAKRLQNINNVLTPTDSETKLTLGANVAVGAELDLNQNWTFGLMDSLHWPFRVKQSHQPSLGGYFNKLMLTVFYHF